jgi:radical SAM superfamily enzyme YgiQ (UPF0313 family)
MSEIVLATFNARYSHTAFGLRYLLANAPPDLPRPKLFEFDLKYPVEKAAAMLAQSNPQIVGLGVYIWNAALMEQLAAQIRQVLPRATLVLGGPEISYETDQQALASCADHVICGEGDLAFHRLAEEIYRGRRQTAKIIHAEAPDLRTLQLPYSFYTDADLLHRIVYVETSRGCPFACDYCISAVGPPLRYFDLDRVLPEFDRLVQRGARVLKFVDRTFNLDIERALAVLDFFLQRIRPDLVLHFEMAPDRFPPALLQLLSRFPKGTLDLEIGVQTFNPEVAQRIQRAQNYAVIEDRLRWLREQTGAVLHVDLIAGLPGESWESIRAGFDRLVALRPHRIQLGILKRLRGAPISRHDAHWNMRYQTEAPYAVVSSSTLSSDDLVRISRMAKFWERIANRQNFPRTLERIRSTVSSPWDFFMGLSDWFFDRFHTDHAVTLRDLAAALFEYATRHAGFEKGPLADDITADYAAGNRRRDAPRLRF